ncbi:hypothetical protein ABT336_10395 [Micromonospora sp. NPDC000207]|uniref:hypothetical protein n=1 Tax=Micromonospora sp. NPDC000207 TaxID=3154246 RepID=UPI00331AACF9
MARHAKTPSSGGLLWRMRRIWPFGRPRARPIDRPGLATIHAERVAAYRAIGVARVVYLPERPLLTLAGEYRAGLWS